MPEKPAMTKAEIELLDSYIPFGGKVLEFGSGGSTMHFFEQGVLHLTSIESDLDWLNKLVADPCLRHFASKHKWLSMYADIGPTVEWGNPQNFCAPECKWLSYHQYCWQSMPHADFDMVLVDGRFRVACLFQCLLRCPEQTIYFVHDFVGRPHYLPMLEFTDQIDQADTAVVLRCKKDVDWKALAIKLQNHLFDFS